MEEIGLIKVASNSNPKSLAGLISLSIKSKGSAELQAIGAGAVNQAIKAIAIARGYMAPSGYEISCTPVFATANVEGEERTGIKLIVK